MSQAKSSGVTMYRESNIYGGNVLRWKRSFYHVGVGRSNFATLARRYDFTLRDYMVSPGIQADNLRDKVFCEEDEGGRKFL